MVMKLLHKIYRSVDLKDSCANLLLLVELPLSKMK